MEPAAVAVLADAAAEAIGASAGALYVADYALRQLRRIGDSGPTSASHRIEGSLAGRAFATGETASAGEGSSRHPAIARTTMARGTSRTGRSLRESTCSIACSSKGGPAGNYRPATPPGSYRRDLR